MGEFRFSILTMNSFVKIFFLFILSLIPTLDASCCGNNCPKTCPIIAPCSPGEQLTKDICNCCDVCVKVREEGESCGATYDGTLLGVCASGLFCKKPDPHKNQFVLAALDIARQQTVAQERNRP